MRNTSFLIPIVVIAIAGILSSLFIVDEREKVLILRSWPDQTGNHRAGSGVQSAAAG